jgi:hypothetical protein
VASKLPLVTKLDEQLAWEPPELADVVVSRPHEMEPQFPITLKETRPLSV